MPRQLITVLILLILQFSNTTQATDLLQRDYQGFTLWLDCETHHGAVAFFYEIKKDTGNIDRSGFDFEKDPSVPASCQAKSTRSYRTKTVPPDTGTWDRGHLVPANHMDNNRTAFQDTFYLTNILPQASTFNQSAGAWFQTEIITECYRDITPLKIWGGVIWGTDIDNDYFTETHKIQTPDTWWKLIYRADKNTYIAWLFPNDKSTKATKIDDYLVSIKALASKVDFLPTMEEIQTAEQSKTSWRVKRLGKTLNCEGRSTSIG